jgi:hypothetical protein
MESTTVDITREHLARYLVSRRGYTHAAADLAVSRANFDGYMDHEQRATVESIVYAPDFPDFMDECARYNTVNGINYPVEQSV